MKPRVVAHAGQYEDGREYVRVKYPNHYAQGAFSVQCVGEGHQRLKWAVVIYPLTKKKKMMA